MAEKPRDIETIFNTALKKASGKERSSYLDKVCGTDHALRARVEALLEASQEVGNFLEPPVVDSDVTLDESPGIEGPGTKIGHYELLELIGEGGMGLVYLAEQKEPVKRRVALKIIKPGMDSKQVIARFEAERQALAVLDHPNIAHVFDAGTTEAGRPYFVMEHVKGMSITAYCDERKLNIEQRLRLFEQVCEGIHHAHQKGIIHRDLKPSNILVSVHGDRAVPKIIDFGIAKAITQPLTEKTFVTFQGQLLGTPEYMSPEQVDLATQDIDTRSDIYALGVVLYELLAGVLPFERKSLAHLGFAEVQRTIREQEPASPSNRITSLGEEAKTIAASRGTEVITLARRLHRELEWIPMKAMRKDRCRRYRSASEMADDVRNYLNGLPLIAGPETTIYRVQKFVSKHAGSVATIALVAAAIVLGLVASTLLYFRSEKALQREATARVQAEDAKDKEAAARILAEQAEKAARKQSELAEEQRKIAQEQAEANRQALYFARVAEAQAVSKYLPVDQTRRILKSCPEDLRAWEWYYLWRVSDPSLLAIEGHYGYMSDIEWSPCGRYFASAGAEDNTTKVWDAETGTEILTLNDQKGPVFDVAFSPNGSLLAIACSDKLVRLYAIPNGTEVFKLQGHDNEVRCVAFSSSGKQLVSGDFDGVIKVWDASTGANEATIKNPDGYVGSVAFMHGTDQIVVRSGKLVKVWDVATQTELMTLHGHTGDVRCVVVTPDGKRIVSGGEDSMIKVWDALSGKELMTLRGHTDIVSMISISSDGTRLVSAGLRDKMVKIWDLRTGQELLTYRGHVSWVSCVAFSPDGQRIVSGGAWGDIKVWDATGDPSRATFEAHHNSLISLVFSPDGNSIVSCSTDGAIKLWDTASGVEMSTWGEFDRVPLSVAYHPNGKKIASGYDDGRIVVWDTTNNSKIRTILAHDDVVTYLAFSSDGRRLASGSRDKTVKIWDTTKWNCELVLVGHENSVWSVSFSPNAKYLVSGDSDGTIRVWDTSNGAMVKVLRGHKGRVISVAFTTDGQRIISGSRYDFVRVWDLHEGVELMVLGEKPLYARAMAVSPDGRRIAYINPAESRVVVLDTATGTQALAIPIPGTLLTSLAFSPNGRTIALACDKRIFLFESDVPASVYKLRRDAGKSRDLFDQLHAELGSSSKIADRLRVDTTYDKKVRELVLQICLSRQWDELDRQVKESMETSRIVGKDITEYERAMRQAQKVNNSQPDDQFGLTALGVAQYRVGSYEEALKSLTMANDIWMSSHKEAHRLSLAFAAMTLYHLGLVEEGRTSMTIMRDNLENATFENLRSQKYYESYRIEAEKIFAGKNKQLLTIWELIDAKELDQAIEVFFRFQPHSEEADSEYSFSLAGLAECLSRACYARGKSRLVDKDLGYVNRASDYEAAVRIDPNYVSALKDLAWLRATCAIEEVRNSEKAVEVASRVCELTDWKDHECLSVLAAACSESERFADAVRWQQEAIDCLPTEDEDQVKWEGNYGERLRLYKSGMPYSAGERWSFIKGRLVAAWDFNDVEEGIVNDRIVGLEGRLVDGAEIVADEERGNVLGIHGQGGIECHRDAAFDISGAISIGAWFKLQPLTTSWRTIISKSDGWSICANSDSNSVDMRIRIMQNEKYLKGLTYDPSWEYSILAGVDLTDKRWHHVAGTYDGERIFLYIDGKSSNFISISGNIATNDNIVVIGDDPGWSSDNWTGLIDDVRIYSYALSPEEVRMLYEGKEPPRAKLRELESK